MGFTDFIEQAFALENRKETFETLAGLGGAASSLLDGVVRSSGEKARARALRARAALIAQGGTIGVAASRREGRRVIGAQIAVRGYQGVTMSGSSLDVLAESATDAAFNTQIIAWNYATAVEAAHYEARLASFAADQQLLAGISGAAGSISSVSGSIGKLTQGVLGAPTAPPGVTASRDRR